MKNEKRKAKKIGVLTSEYKNKNLRFCTDSVPGSIAVYVHFQKGFPCFLICLIHYKKCLALQIFVGMTQKVQRKAKKMKG